MALDAPRGAIEESTWATSSPVDRRNDAFSFWKLPEEWRPCLDSSIEPSSIAAERLLTEAYLSGHDHYARGAMRAYYNVKGIIPRTVRHHLNSVAIRMRTQPSFPHWPCESALIELRRAWLILAMDTLGIKDGWHLGFWPNDHKCCIVLTHDVETRQGFDRMEAMADVEERFGFRSAWNLPLAQYPIDWDRVARLRQRGFEFGAHGLSHDGRLFRSNKEFRELAPRLEQLAREHGLRGFRAPSTLRDPKLIGSMNFDFDSSFADTDPFEPQPGGTCSLFPFRLDRLIELPYTLPQDHTLLHLLRRNPLPLWVMKADWIASKGGMILTLTHPDYCGKGKHLALYRELIKHLADKPSAWRALPSEVADWWTDRSHSSLRLVQRRPVITGPAAGRAATSSLRDSLEAQDRRHG